MIISDKNFDHADISFSPDISLTSAFTSVHMDDEVFNGQRQKLEKLLDSASLKQLQIRDPSFDY
jgi:hypothetical protein